MIVRGTNTSGAMAEGAATILAVLVVAALLTKLILWGAVAVALVAVWGAAAAAVDRHRRVRAYRRWEAQERARRAASESRRLDEQPTMRMRRVDPEDELRRAKREAGGIWP